MSTRNTRMEALRNRAPTVMSYGFHLNHVAALRSVRHPPHSRLQFLLVVLLALPPLLVACSTSTGPTNGTDTGSPPGVDEPPYSRSLQRIVDLPLDTQVGSFALGPDGIAYLSTVGTTIDANYVLSIDVESRLERWRYRIPDGISGLALRSSGNVTILAGNGETLHELTPAGDLAWTRSHPDRSFRRVDSHGDELFAQTSNGEIYRVDADGSATLIASVGGRFTTLLGGPSWITVAASGAESTVTMTTADGQVAWQQELGFRCGSTVREFSRGVAIACHVRRFEFGENRYFPSVLALDSGGSVTTLYESPDFFVGGEQPSFIGAFGFSDDGSLFLIDATRGDEYSGYLVKVGPDNQVQWERRAYVMSGFALRVSGSNEVIAEALEYSPHASVPVNRRLQGFDSTTGDVVWRAGSPSSNHVLHLSSDGRLFTVRRELVYDRPDALAFIRTNATYE